MLKTGFVALLAALTIAGANASDLASVTDATETAAPDARTAAGQANAAAIAASPACARKVKVIYSGYGEGDRAGCAPAGR